VLLTFVIAAMCHMLGHRAWNPCFGVIILAYAYEVEADSTAGKAEEEITNAPLSLNVSSPETIAGYCQSVYGASSCNFDHLKMFYTSCLKQAGISYANRKCPTNANEWFEEGIYYRPPNTWWKWRPPRRQVGGLNKYHSLPGGSWQEVMHMADPFGDEHFGSWFIWTPGSSIWFNLGKTKGFIEHSNAYDFIGVNVQGFGKNEAMCQGFAKKGYASIQFLQHKDHVNYPCWNQVPSSQQIMGLEIVGVALEGTHACGYDCGGGDHHKNPCSKYRSGSGARSPCHCDPHLGFLNCEDVPVTQGRRVCTHALEGAKPNLTVV